MNAHDPDLPLVTVVTPSFNQGRFIGETIESVLNQDYHNIEYIVVDGDSTDNTATVVRPYLNRLTFISEPDDGQSHAINKGFALARGSIVAWLNSDDVYIPGAVSAAVKAFRQHPEAAAVYGEGYQIDERGELKSRFPYTQHFDRWKLTFASDYILQQATFFRKEALDAVGPLREDLNFVMDWEILIRLAKRFELVHVSEYMGAIREYETAKTSAGGVKRGHEVLRMLRGHCGTLFPPGYFIYGFVAYERSLVTAIDRWPRWAAPAATLARKAVDRALFTGVHLAMTRAQRWHRDGWAAPRVRVMLSEGSGEAVIRGQIPGNIPNLTKQRVRVLDGARVLGEQEFPPGIFEMRVQVRERTRGSCPILDLEASESFILSKLGISGDKRTLSFKLLDVRWASPKTFSLAIPLAESA